MRLSSAMTISSHPLLYAALGSPLLMALIVQFLSDRTSHRLLMWLLTIVFYSFHGIHFACTGRFDTIGGTGMLVIFFGLYLVHLR